MTQASVRASNLALVFGEVIANTGAVSRADIAGRLGMTRSTVSRLVDDLILGQLVDEGEAVGGARGRPAVPLHVRSGTVLALGLEVNVERMVSTLVDLTGDTVSRHSLDLNTAELSLEDAMRHLSELAEQTLTDVPPGARLAGAMLAFPGLVDREGRKILRAPNLAWEGHEPPNYWDVSFDGEPLPLVIRNDIDCSALTVLRDTPGTSFLYLTGEVGIGAAVSLDGTLLTGRHGWASEVGHICVDPQGDICGCGAVGCLETIAGLHGFLRIAGEATMDDVVAALEAKDEQALAAVQRLAEALGIAIGAALNLLDISTVRLGGHLGRLGEWLCGPLGEELVTRVLWAPHSGIDLEVIERAPLRPAMGAGLAALNHVIQDPAAWVDPIIER
ncbi:MAG: ROK family transcriptional regulator [Propionibacteriaceae bacterium]|nr:ROK family transcriptional regulator [Propionibacteriaceae bacterium]